MGEEFEAYLQVRTADAMRMYAEFRMFFLLSEFGFFESIRDLDELTRSLATQRARYIGAIMSGGTPIAPAIATVSNSTFVDNRAIGGAAGVCLKGPGTGFSRSDQLP